MSIQLSRCYLMKEGLVFPTPTHTWWILSLRDHSKQTAQTTHNHVLLITIMVVYDSTVTVISSFLMVFVNSSGPRKLSMSDRIFLPSWTSGPLDYRESYLYCHLLITFTADCLYHLDIQGGSIVHRHYMSYSPSLSLKNIVPDTNVLSFVWRSFMHNNITTHIQHVYDLLLL